MEKEEKKVIKYELVNVPTQFGTGIKTPEGEVITTEEALVEVLNSMREIRKALMSE